MAPLTQATATNDKREIFGWAMYDWANSAFSTTVGAVFLGPYLAALVEAAAKASPDGQARFFGLPVAPDSFLPFMISFSVVFQAGFLPILHRRNTGKPHWLVSQRYETGTRLVYDTNGSGEPKSQKNEI